MTALSARAAKVLHAQRPFHKAVFLEATGTPRASTPTVKTAGGIVKWRFVFDNQPTGGKYKSVSVEALNGKFGKARGYTEPLRDDQAIPSMSKMTLAQAITRLNSAGYTKGFYIVNLKKPLKSGVTHPLYIFGMANGKYIAVDTVTGKVKPFSS